MVGPVLSESGFAKQATVQDSLALTYTFTTTPVAGDIIVVKFGTWGATDTMSAPTGGSQTFRADKIAAPGGFNQWAAVYSCKISGSPGNFTITSTPSSSSRHSMEVERWTQADRAATSAVNATSNGTGAAQTSLTTTGANSVISWTSGDASSQDPAGRTALSNNTFENVRDDHVGANGVDYHGYMTTTTAGSYTFGMSAPTGQTWVMAGMEILAGSSTTPFTKDVVERYRVLNGFTKDVVERYRVTNAWTKDVVETYRVLNSLTKDVVERYRVLNALTKDVIERYRVLNSISVDVTERYRVLTGLAKDVVERYRITNALVVDVVERYRVLAVWSKDVIERYDVLAGTAWTKNVVERYRIFSTFALDFVERYTIGDTPALPADAIAYLGPVVATIVVTPSVYAITTDLSPAQATAYL